MQMIQAVTRALASAFLLVLLLPRPSIGWLAPVALVPLLAAARSAGSRRWAFMVGWITGFTWFFISLNWLSHTLRTFGGIPLPVAQLLIVLMAAILGVYTGLFGLTAQMIGDRGPASLLGLPSMWVVLEVIRCRVPATFPWLVLGDGLWSVDPLRWIYGVAGVFGASFLIVLLNVVLWQAFRALASDQRKKAALISGAFLTAVGLLFAVDLINPRSEAGPRVTAGVIQGNFEQELKWDESLRTRALETYLDLSRKAVDEGAEILLWPETAMPFYFQAEAELASQLRQFAVDEGVDLVFGSPGFRMEGDELFLYNRAYHLMPDGGIASYDKMVLVPFGEYIPFKPLLSWVEKLVPGEGEFRSGTWQGPFRTRQPAGTLICYEATIPRIPRMQVSDGAVMLLNITNDAWFGTTWGPYQHLTSSAVRAAEQGVPLLRAANTGVSAVIDRQGALVKTVGLFERNIIVATIETGVSGTLYTRWGDWIVYLSIIMIIMIGLTKLLPGGTGHGEPGRL